MSDFIININSRNGIEFFLIKKKKDNNRIILKSKNQLWDENEKLMMVWKYRLV